MKTFLRTIPWLLLLTTAAVLPGVETLPLDPHLAPLQPLIEKTWKGIFKQATGEKSTVDVMRWERALNGKAIRVLHSINDGVYGGETIIRWDAEKQSVVYHYFTTAGFITTGTMKFQEGKLLSNEVVSGNQNGITAVRATSALQPDGSFQVKTEHQKEGQWVPGHEVTYQEDKSAKVVFR